MITGRRTDKKNLFHLRMSFHVFFNNKVSLGNLSSSSALQSFFPTLLFSHHPSSGGDRSACGTCLKPGCRQECTELPRLWYSREIGSSWDGGTGLLNHLCHQGENVLWTASFSIANTAILTCAWLHVAWEVHTAQERCSECTTETKQDAHGLGECGEAEDGFVYLFIWHGCGLGFMWGEKKGGLVSNLIN